MYCSVCLLAGLVKICWVVPNSTTSPHVKKRGEVRHPGGLLHIVGHDDDGVLGFQLVDQFFHLGGTDGVDGRAGFIHQQEFRLHHDGPGDAQPLLLPAGQGRARAMQDVFDFIPQGGALRASSTRSASSLLLSA